MPRAPSPVLARKDPSFLLRQANPPAFPDHLILPAPRGAVIASVPWPEAPKPAAPKKPRKVAKGKSAKRRPTTARKTAPKKAKAPARASPRKSAAPAVPPPSTEPPAAMTTIDLLDRALALEPEPAPELRPLVPAPLSATASPDMAESAPLPRSHSLTHPRGSGLLETIAQWFRSLASWRRARAASARDRTQLARASARQRALQSQLEALEALQAGPTPPSA
ncbi:hypothetical protein [Novosphingobium jiangmenense]|uniref:Uncharacterized protein n=1 Tax=Novosphingobium jiangmenense TaxID=2791981 RepID=A0ABS0HIY4_9SPHN|nr:hypothetical protein [Novosphingobium jiangmenense]MBF9151959.1 hypothetical protein [Novosphingobium jiangmenense]